MKFFLDTANLDEIRQGASFGILDGVTTNPTLAAKEKKPFRELILEICDIVKDGAISAEVVSTDLQGMLREAREVVSWHPNVVAKIPMTPDGVRALSILSREGVRVNVTLVFSPAQALIAAKAGAYFVSPFLGRLDDISIDGLAVLREILEIYRAYDYKTQVLAASLRHPLHVVEAAKMGAHIGTMPYKVFEMLFKHPLTDRGLEAFLKDWDKARETLGDITEAAGYAQRRALIPRSCRLARHRSRGWTRSPGRRRSFLPVSQEARRLARTRTRASRLLESRRPHRRRPDSRGRRPQDKPRPTSSWTRNPRQARNSLRSRLALLPNGRTNPRTARKNCSTTRTRSLASPTRPRRTSPASKSRPT